jgi:hypothetical protein
MDDPGQDRRAERALLGMWLQPQILRLVLEKASEKIISIVLPAFSSLLAVIRINLDHALSFMMSGAGERNSRVLAIR